MAKSENYADFDENKKTAPKPKKGYYHNYSRDDLKRAGLVPLDEKGRMLKCFDDKRVLCFYDNHLLDSDFGGQIASLKKCNQCGTLYLFGPSKERPIIITEAIGVPIEPLELPKPSDLEIKAEESPGEELREERGDSLKEEEGNTQF